VIPSLPRQLPFFPVDIEQSDRPNDISEYEGVTGSRHALEHIAVIPFRHKLDVQRILPFCNLYELEYLDLEPNFSLSPSSLSWAYCGVHGQRQSVLPGNDGIHTALDRCARNQVQ